MTCKSVARLCAASAGVVLGAGAMAAPAKTFLVTGATDGIGRFTATRLGADGHRVLVHGRSRAKVEAVVKEISDSGGGSAEGFVADLSSMAAVRQLGAKVGASCDALDGLLNNAGTFDGDYKGGGRVVTAEGYEYSLAVNVLAPFVLTSLLLEKVQRSGAGRILLTSSMSMGCGDALDDLNLERRWSSHRAYSLSKLCDAMLAVELSRRYGDPPRLCVNTMDPGTVNTKMLRAGWGAGGIPVNAATTSYHMLVDDAWGKKTGEVNGAYPNPEVSDAAQRVKLWDACLKFTGATYPPATNNPI